MPPCSSPGLLLTFTCADGGQPVKWLNELEWVEGLIWGNVWQTDCIAQVRPGLRVCCRSGQWLWCRNGGGKVVGWQRQLNVEGRVAPRVAERLHCAGRNSGWLRHAQLP